MNGLVTRELGTLADPSRDVITVDGRPLPPAEPKRYVVLHKPRGYVTTRSDPGGRPVVTDLVPGPERLYPVGRLDVDVEGLLVLTNDGPLTHRLLHPRYGVPRRYEADVTGLVRRHDLDRWQRGAVLDDGPAKPLMVKLVAAGANASRLHLTFTEGRKHEVKRYCEAMGHPIVRLRRIGFGPLELGTLRPGESRELSRAELRALRAAGETPASGRAH